MSGYKRERKALARQIANLESYGQHSSDEQRLNRLKLKLMVLDSDRLRERAMRFGVNLVEAVGPWHTDEARMWLREKEQTNARRVINDARFDWWKRWIGLLSPAVSVLIALLALLLAALALYLQLKGKIPRPPATH